MKLTKKESEMELALKIAQLETLPLSELSRQWKHYFGTDCDVQKKEFYIGRIAYALKYPFLRYTIL